MIHHHQTQDALDALARHQLVVFVGARGTGKTCLIADVAASLRSSGVEVLTLDAEAAQSPSNLNEPLAAALQCPADRMTASSIADDLRLRVLVDNCDALHEKSWFPAMQDEWRGLLGESRARGRISLLLAGRPLFRRIAEGRGSPLIGIGTYLPARPLTRAEIESLFEVESNVAEKARAKTGGHPQLTRRLLDAIERDITKLGTHYADFAKSQRRFLVQLIEDHGAAAGSVLVDLMSSTRDAWVSESSILARHFGGSSVLGLDLLDDLAASGLIERNDGTSRLAAEILRTDRDLGPHLAAPPFTVVEEPSAEFSEAATQLFRIENRLRRLVGEALSGVEQTWWPSRIPANLVPEVERRRRGESESPAPASAETHPIAYLSLGELFEVVVEDTNWQEVFRVRLGMSRDAFSQTSTALSAVRNKVAHNRPVTADDLIVIRMAWQRLGITEG